MSLINKAVESLFNGVSQQPAQLRLSSQCELQENFYPTIATGLNKRPPTRFKAKLSSSTDREAYVSIINRDLSERYALIIRNGALDVFDAITGAQKTVTTPSGTSYLASTDPAKDFSSVTVADYTFIINRSKTVRYTSEASPANVNAGYVVFTYSGAGVSRTMTVTVNGVSASWSGSANDTGASITYISASLSTALGAGWSVTTKGNLMRIAKADSATWTLECSDNYGNATMRVVKESVQLFSDLPPNVDDGAIFYVTSTPNEGGKGYYVKYVAASKAYVECPAPGIFTTLDPATMPHKLVRNSDGTFTFAPLTWAPRKVGDYASNPWPTFTGRKINEVFFYRNRLGFLSDENVILSTAGDFFNLFAKTATAVTDADPIDEAVSNTKVSLLRFAVPFNKTLMLFADQTQFQLTGGDVLTPKSVKADPATEFISSAICRPVGAGQQLFFVSDKPNASSVREYFVQTDTFTNDASDITAHVPSYIPTGVFRMAVSTTEDTLVALTTAERNALYVYKYYWGAQEKVQSAWSKFLLDSEDVLMGAEFVGSVLHLVVGRSDGIYLEEMGMQAAAVDTGLPFNVLLDRKVYLTGTYNASTNTTSWTLPWAPTGVVQMVLGASYGSRAGSSSGLSLAGGNVVTAPGDYSSGPVFIGTMYVSRFRFSEQYMKDAKNQPIASAVIKMRRMMVTYAGTGYFRAEVTPKARSTSTYLFTGKTLGGDGVRLGNPSMSSGSFRFPVMAGSKGVTIDLVNDSPFPSCFQSAEWEGEMVVQAQRV